MCSYEACVRQRVKRRCVLSKFKDWLKVFGLSFFSDKIASRAAKKGATLIIISLIFTFVFFFCGYLGASVVPFSTHYKNADGYRSFLYGVFTDENALNLAMDGGKAKVTKSDNTEIQVVNTYENATDAEKYAKNGYNLIIDTRSSRSFIEFEEYAVNGDERISYETYLGLGKAEKSNYQLRVHCTDELYTIGEKEVTKFTAFFDDITSSESKNYNSAAAIAYKKLNKNAPSYNDDLYRLYVKYYYTDISSVVTGESVPVLRDYYYREYVHNSNSHYFYIFDDMCAGSFETNNEIQIRVIELKDERPLASLISHQIPWYIKWVDQYIAPNLLSKNKPVIIIPTIFAYEHKRNTKNKRDFDSAVVNFNSQTRNMCSNATVNNLDCIYYDRTQSPIKIY